MVFDRTLGKSYEKVGNAYHFGRTDYPQKLINDIVKLSGIQKDSLLLDIGCGTGKSTLPFVKKGYKILGIDISQDMLRVAKRISRKYETAQYKKISFENAKLPQGSFDLLLFGSSIHWTDKTITYKKIVELLKKDGTVAIFWKLIDHDSNKFLLKIRSLFVKHCPGYYHAAPSKTRAKRSVKIVTERLIKSNYFTKPIVKKYASLETYTKKNFVNLVNSYSWVASLNKRNKDVFLHELGKIMYNETKTIKIREKFYLIIAKLK